MVKWRSAIKQRCRHDGILHLRYSGDKRRDGVTQIGLHSTEDTKVDGGLNS